MVVNANIPVKQTSRICTYSVLFHNTVICGLLEIIAFYQKYCNELHVKCDDVDGYCYDLVDTLLCYLYRYFILRLLCNLAKRRDYYCDSFFVLLFRILSESTSYCTYQCKHNHLVGINKICFAKKCSIYFCTDIYIS